MGTNYYRIATENEMGDRKERLQVRLIGLKLTPELIERGFRYIDDTEDEWTQLSPWDEFIEGTNIHLGKRSMGWKFCWNFHNNKFYSNKEEMLEFIRRGRIVDEYGSEEPVEEFIKMALEWGYPEGLVVNAEYYKNHEGNSLFNDPKHYDREIDGLRVSSSTEFS